MISHEELRKWIEEEFDQLHMDEGEDEYGERQEERMVAIDQLDRLRMWLLHREKR